MKKILVFGNPLMEEDNLALKILPKLRLLFPHIEFKEFDAGESFNGEGKHLTILDVVDGIDKVQVLDQVDDLQIPERFTMHDFDLAYNLRLLKFLDKIETIMVIGLPMHMDEDDVLNEAVRVIGGLKA
ncbi:MAG: hypothetical protein ABIB79_00300 [archaeon]